MGVVERGHRALARVEEERAVGDRKQAVELVRHHHHGHAERRTQLQDQRIEPGRGQRIQPGRGLVEKEQRRIGAQRARDGGALAHAAAEFGGQALEAAVQPDQREPEARLQRQLGLVERPAQPAVVVAQALALREHQVLADAHRAPQRAGLEHHAQAAAQAPAHPLVGIVQVRALEQDAPGRRRLQPDHVAQQRALAAAAAAHDRQDLAAAHREVQTLLDDALAVRHRQALDPHDVGIRRHHHPSLWKTMVVTDAATTIQTMACTTEAVTARPTPSALRCAFRPWRQPASPTRPA